MPIKKTEKAKVISPKTIFKDKKILVLDKPAGWVVNKAQTTRGQLTIQDWLAKKFDFPIFKLPQCRNGIVHRLDKETSGILIVAQDEASFSNLQEQFKKRLVKKVYTALAHGKVIPKTGEINVPVGRLTWNRQRFGVVPGGRQAKTDYKVMDYFMDPKTKANYTLIELKPKTGRTHQIRVHLKHLGHPIVADDFYAGRKTSREDKKWCPRLFLHAAEISFQHPQTKKKVHFQSPLPSDLEKALSHLQKEA